MQIDPAASVPPPADPPLVVTAGEIGLVRAAFERHGAVPAALDQRWHLSRLVEEAGDGVVDSGLGHPALIPVDVTPGEVRTILAALKALQRDAAVHGALASDTARMLLAGFLRRLEDR
ncbi:MAG: hypothetical protein LC789_13475 [Actinobacteria bacterium]|nr:hypothetical protein [Actinomycetota bacterium]MCA1721177.1 hypothetical protein [Actinomycetota bacterium]